MPIDAHLSAAWVMVTGRIDIPFADYGIEQPTSFIVLSIEDHGIMEFQLHFRSGAEPRPNAMPGPWRAGRSMVRHGNARSVGPRVHGVVRWGGPPGAIAHRPEVLLPRVGPAVRQRGGIRPYPPALRAPSKETSTTASRRPGPLPAALELRPGISSVTATAADRRTR